MSTRATVNFSIDVPDLAAGVRFYESVFGFVEVARPFPNMAILDAGNASLCLHAKDEGSSPAPGSDEVRRYRRHWTPVHLDLHVPALEPVLARVQAEGGIVEQTFRSGGPKPTAFCSDPFGHGFCVIAEALD